MTDGATRTSGGQRTVLPKVARALTWLLLTVVGIVAVLVVIIPALIGAQRYTILGSSMEPAIPLGSLVVVKPTEIEDVSPGAVITFQLESGESAVATHRVVGVGVQGDGAALLVTQGDANDSADLEPVRAEQLRGEVLYSLPVIGWMNVVVTDQVRSWLAPIASGALLVYAAWMFVGAWRERRALVPADQSAASL